MADLDLSALKSEIDQKITTKTASASITQIIVGSLLKDFVDVLQNSINDMPDPAAALQAANAASLAVTQLSSSLGGIANKADTATMAVASLSGNVLDLQELFNSLPSDLQLKLSAIQETITSLSAKVSPGNLPNTTRQIPLNNTQTTIIDNLSLAANIVLTPKISDKIEGGSAIFTIIPNGFLVDVSAFVDLGSPDITKLIPGKPATFCFSCLGGQPTVFIRIAPANLQNIETPEPVIVGTSPISVTDVMQTSLTLVYDLPENADSVEVEQSLTSDFASHTSINGKNVTGLTAGTRYYYRMRGVNNGVCGVYTYADASTLSTSVIDNSVATPGYSIIQYFDFANETYTRNSPSEIADHIAIYNSNNDASAILTGDGFLTLKSFSSPTKIYYNQFTSDKHYKMTFYNVSYNPNLRGYFADQQRPEIIISGQNGIMEFTAGTNNTDFTFDINGFGASDGGIDFKFSAFKLEVQK